MTEVSENRGTAPAGDAARQFVYLCLRGRWDRGALAAARALADSPGLDWEEVAEFASIESLAPLLHHSTRGSNLMPVAVERLLRDAYDENVGRNSLLFIELEGILRRLDQVGIEVLLLKGAALSKTVYGRAAVRPMNDIDLLVRKERIPDAVGVLSGLGFQRFGIEPRPGSELAFGSQVALHKAGVWRLTVEIHWDLFDSPHHQSKLPIEWFWHTAQLVQVGQIQALVLSPEAQLLHLCGHLALHHSGAGVLWMHDVAEVIVHDGHRLDWAEVLDRAKRFDLVLPMQQTLVQVVDQWRVQVPDGVLTALRGIVPSDQEKEVFGQLAAGERPVALRFRTDLAATSTWRGRLRYALIQLFPSPAYMRYRYRVGSWLLMPLYYPYRWLLGLRSWFRTLSQSQ